MNLTAYEANGVETENDFGSTPKYPVVESPSATKTHAARNGVGTLSSVLSAGHSAGLSERAFGQRSRTGSGVQHSGLFVGAWRNSKTQVGWSVKLDEQNNTGRLKRQTVCGCCSSIVDILERFIRAGANPAAPTFNFQLSAARQQRTLRHSGLTRTVLCASRPTMPGVMPLLGAGRFNDLRQKQSGGMTSPGDFEQA
jgi:hypothetical protein